MLYVKKVVVPLWITCFLLIPLACGGRIKSVTTQTASNFPSIQEQIQISQVTSLKTSLSLESIQAPLVFDISLRGKTEAGAFGSIPARLEIWPASPGDPNSVRVALFMPVEDQSKLGNGSIFWQSYSLGHPKRKKHYSLIKFQGMQVQMELVSSPEFRSDVMWMVVKTNIGRTSITPKRGTVTFSIQGNRVIGQVQAVGVSDLSLEEAPTSTYQAEFSGQRGTLLPADVEGLNSLKIQPNDSWEQVVTKAISLRNLGLINESIASFARYGEMFTSSDPTASLYSKTAQQFSRQSRVLGLEGGVYIYQLVRDGSATKAGLQVGDIIIEYGSNVISGMDDLVKVRNSMPKGKSLSLTYLRLEREGRFQRRTATVINPMGARFMPI